VARDRFHNSVKQGLIKDGWTITDDPLYLRLDGELFQLEVDLGAQKLIAAQKGPQKIAVEVKSFQGSLINEFHTALGQWLNYQQALERLEPNRKLFLALPEESQKLMLRSPFIRKQIQTYRLALLGYDPVKEVIVSWN